MTGDLRQRYGQRARMGDMDQPGRRARLSRFLQCERLGLWEHGCMLLVFERCVVHGYNSLYKTLSEYRQQFTKLCHG